MSDSDKSSLSKWILKELSLKKRMDVAETRLEARLIEALSIAWEALEIIIANPVAACSDRHDVVAQDAMRRISELSEY